MLLSDYVLIFDPVSMKYFAELESVAGWKTASMHRPVQFSALLAWKPGCVSSYVTSRSKPRSSTSTATSALFHPKPKSFASRACSSSGVTRHATISILWRWRKQFDDLYPQTSGESALQQLQVQLSNALPFDLEEMELAEYRNLNAK